VIKLLFLVALALVAWKSLSGRWPWEAKRALGSAASRRARTLLGVETTAGRQDILEAHRRLIATVHPDRGGSNALVHEANEARDVLLADLQLDLR